MISCVVAYQIPPQKSMTVQVADHMPAVWASQEDIFFQMLWASFE
jgi:hypothetical protein